MSEPKGEIVRVEPTPNDLLAAAIDKGLSVEGLEKLVALKERMEDRAAAQEFAVAMSEFQAKCPPIPKTSKATIVTKGGTKYGYTYAELDTIAKHIGPLLHENGLSYTWDSEVTERTLRCTCVLRHVNGHKVEASFSCPVEPSGSMSAAQGAASALTYARRQALIQVLGLTTCDLDADAGKTETITESQAADLEALADEVKANMDAFRKFLKVEDLRELRASEYRAAVAALEQKRRRG